MIQRIYEKDIALVSSVYAESWRESHKELCSPEFLERHTEAYQVEFLVSRLREGWRLYAELIGSEAAGLVGLHILTGEIGLLYVHPDVWGRGYGRGLLNFAVSEMKKYNTPCLSVLNTNARAIRIYERYGFVFTGEKRVLSEEKGIAELSYIFPAK